jgi:hypothetical protein
MDPLAEIVPDPASVFALINRLPPEDPPAAHEGGVSPFALMEPSTVNVPPTVNMNAPPPVAPELQSLGDPDPSSRGK